jgi:hypothetical protein
VKRLMFCVRSKTKGEVRLDDTETPFPALGAPMSLAWVHESPCVEGSALPKSVESGKLSLNKVGIGRMSVTWR